MINVYPKTTTYYSMIQIPKEIPINKYRIVHTGPNK